MIPDSIYWHCFRTLPGLGQQRLGKIMTAFGSGEEAWHAPDSAFSGLGLSTDALESIASRRRDVDPDVEEARLAQERIRILIPSDPAFPKLLPEAESFAILYAKGNLSDLDRPLISIVGSRRFTNYGKQAAEHLSKELSRAGFGIVSGLAYGIDSIAHEATLREGGITIAVLGDSLDDASIHPKNHLALAGRIQKQGLLLSEYPPVTAANPGTFPARNRIVAGISLGTIVIEAAEESGSLITAKLALEYDREVFSVPGSIFSPASAGTNRLIREGAKIVRNATDVLEEIPSFRRRTPEAAATEQRIVDGLSQEEASVLKILSHEPSPVDEIIKASHCKASAVSTALTMLELKGLAKNVGGNGYIRT